MFSFSESKLAGFVLLSLYQSTFGLPNVLEIQDLQNRMSADKDLLKRIPRGDTDYNHLRAVVMKEADAVKELIANEENKLRSSEIETYIDELIEESDALPEGDSWKTEIDQMISNLVLEKASLIPCGNSLRSLRAYESQNDIEEIRTRYKGNGSLLEANTSQASVKRDKTLTASIDNPKLRKASRRALRDARDNLSKYAKTVDADTPVNKRFVTKVPYDLAVFELARKNEKEEKTQDSFSDESDSDDDLSRQSTPTLSSPTNSDDDGFFDCVDEEKSCFSLFSTEKDALVKPREQIDYKEQSYFADEDEAMYDRLGYMPLAPEKKKRKTVGCVLM